MIHRSNSETNLHEVGKGQSASFSNLQLLEPSAPPQIIMTLESKCEVRIQSEIIDPVGAR
jgi:hypothetical protein